MFEIVSQVHPRKNPLTTVVSVSVHAAVIVTAVMATAEARTPRAEPVYEVRLVAPRAERNEAPRRPAAPARPTPRPATAPKTATAPLTAPTAPLTAPTAVPVVIPDASETVSNEPFGDPHVPAGTDVGDAAAVMGTPDEGAPYTEGTVDTPARLKGRIEPPVYPEALRRARFEGVVRVRFVVDTAGRVARELDVLSAADERFVRAVRNALERARFEPAKVRNRPVSQLVEQSFVFRLER